MAGDRGRDLTFSILSDTDKLDLAGPAQDLDRLGQAAEEAGRDLGRLDQDVQGSKIERLGDDAKTTARKVETAFDSIARSSRTSSRKVDTDTDHMRRSLHDVRDEAGSTAREAAASFGSSGDIGDAMQELAANAPAVLGPIGLALGAVTAIGVGLFRTKTEDLKARVDEIVDYFVEAGGKLTKEAVDSEVLVMAKEGDISRLRDLVDLYDVAGVRYEDLVRAKAGDVDAMARVNAALDEESSRRKTSVDELGKSEAAVAALRSELDETAQVMADAKAVTDDYNATTSVIGPTTAAAAETAGGAWDTLRGSMYDPITGRVVVRRPSDRELANIRYAMQQGIGPITVSVYAKPKYDQSTFSRYRP